MTACVACYKAKNGCDYGHRKPTEKSKGKRPAKRRRQDQGEDDGEEQGRAELPKTRKQGNVNRKGNGKKGKGKGKGKGKEREVDDSDAIMASGFGTAAAPPTSRSPSPFAAADDLSRRAAAEITSMIETDAPRHTRPMTRSNAIAGPSRPRGACLTDCEDPADVFTGRAAAKQAKVRLALHAALAEANARALDREPPTPTRKSTIFYLSRISILIQ